MFNTTVSVYDHSYKTARINFDALALACAMYRIYGDNDNESRFVSFTDSLDEISKLLSKHLTDIDIATADAVERHFTSQIMTSVLRDSKLSSFQSAVDRYFRSGRLVIPQPCGLVHRLPEYYDYDVKLGKIRDQYFHQKSPLVRSIGAIDLSLKPLCQLQKHTRSSDDQHYWFQESENQSAVLIIARTSDPTTHIWSSLFNSLPSIKIKGKLIPRQHPSGLFEYYLVGHEWRLQGLSISKG